MTCRRKPRRMRLLRKKTRDNGLIGIEIHTAGRVDKPINCSKRSSRESGNDA